MDRTPDERALLAAALELTDHAPRPRPAHPDPGAPLDVTSRSLDRMALLADVAAAFAAQEQQRPAGAAEPVTALFAWGPLRVVGRLGEGSYGEVFAAWDPALRREVALKLRRAETGALRWLDEARALARVRHPNVLVVHGADLHDERAGIWCERLRGRTLEQELDAAGGPLPVREAARIARDVAAALEAVHRAGLVHGDVTTRNVMLEETPEASDAGVGEAGEDGPERSTGVAGPADSSAPRRVVLMDFGSAGDAGSSSPVATPLSAAPEVLAGGSPTAQSDVYALGVLMYRLLSGRHPIEAMSFEALRKAHADGAGVPLAQRRKGVPPRIARIVERALHPDPARRFESAAALRSALSRALGEFVPIVPVWTIPVGLAGLALIAMLLRLVLLEISRHDGSRFRPPPPPTLAISRRPVWVSAADSADFSRGINITLDSDFDRDGYRDALVSDGHYSLGVRERGRALLYRGGPQGLARTPVVLALGEAPIQTLGDDVASGGDVNGDGWPDALVSTPSQGADPLVFGEVRLLLGGPHGLSTTPAWRITGGRSWSAIADPAAIVKDVNGDGFDDVIVNERDWSGAHRGQGRVSLYLGSAHGPADHPSQVITDQQVEERFGEYCVGVGDANGDGYNDVAIGASIWPGPRGQLGCVCLFLGGPHGLSAKPVRRIVSEMGSEDVGLRCSFCGLGDVNGDGYADVAIGYPTRSSRMLEDGEVRVYLGGPGGWKERPAWHASGFNSGGYFGYAVASGDVNGDGRADLVIGSLGFARNRSTRLAGAVFVYLGTGTAGLFARQPSWWVWSGQPEAHFGERLGVGDANGDGADDILVSATMWRRDSLITSREALFAGVPSRPRPAVAAGTARIPRSGR